MNNIKDIAKELMGKSLNSFHRKQGLEYIDKNNDMQDGILDGILSQVDDGYLTKIEEGSVIHLDNSGDGVVVLNSVEGNSLVNIYDKSVKWKPSNGVIVTKLENGYKLESLVGSSVSGMLSLYFNDLPLNINKTYTFNFNIKITGDYRNENIRIYNNNTSSSLSTTTIIKEGNYSLKVDLINNLTLGDIKFIVYVPANGVGTISISDIIILEGDYTNEPIPSYFEGLQSSFEDKVNDEGKYDVDIEIVNKNLCNGRYTFSNVDLDMGDEADIDKCIMSDYIRVNPKNTYYAKLYLEGGMIYNQLSHRCYDINKNYLGSYPLDNLPLNCAYYRIRALNGVSWDTTKKYSFMFSKNERDVDTYTPHKSNSIHFQLNEPLRGIGGVKDRLCVKDGKLVVERNYKELLLDGVNLKVHKTIDNDENTYLGTVSTAVYKLIDNKPNTSLSDKLPYAPLNESFPHIRQDDTTPYSDCRIYLNKKDIPTGDINDWLKENNVKYIVKMVEPTYEEVLNEYGCPILLEGYERGTLYIDSIIPPTTTVKYTSNIQSLNTIREIKENNTTTTLDVNDNIIPYMMDVDLMIMELEAKIPKENMIRKVGKDVMATMQERTKDMLERLIRSKANTKQEMKDRVVLYEAAERITSEQALELILLIEEVYG